MDSTANSDLIDWRFRGFPATDWTVPLKDVRGQQWNLIRGDLLLPVMVLKESALDHNLSLMARYCQDHGLSLAPHAKTSMAPGIIARQLALGAWGMTAATVSQVRVLRALGVQRVIIANEVVEPAAIAWLARETKRDPGFACFCLVDSVAGVTIIEEALECGESDSKLRVLIEVGAQGGRAGCRSLAQAMTVAAAIRGCDHVGLAGVEGFEGVLREDSLSATVAKVDRFLTQIRIIATHLDQAGHFNLVDEVLVSAGGSAFFDRVACQLGGMWNLHVPVRVVLRSGCYAAHDVGVYRRLSALDGRAKTGERLRPALEVWGAVLSRPEPLVAIVGFGKRDVPYDRELPTPQLVRRYSGAVEAASSGMSITKLDDQHAYVVTDGQELQVGDWLGCGVSHPCTAFDKWRLIPVVDDDYRVVDAMQTFL